MKNKKGITIGRVLLYILFGLVFLMIIWVLVLTYREIAKNPNISTKIECNNTLKLQDSPISISGASYVRNHYYVFYDSNDALLDAYSDLSLNITDYNEFAMPYFNHFAYDIDIYDNVELIHTTPNYYETFNSSKDFDTLFIGDCFGSNGSLSYIVNDLADDMSSELVNFNDYNSCAIVFNLDDIPVQYFNFTISSNSFYTTYPTFFVVDNNGNMFKRQFYTPSSSTRHFNASTDLGISSNTTSFNKLIFFICQRSDSNGINYYNLSNPYNYNSSSNINYLISNNITFDLDFDVYTASSDFQDGYDEGYRRGRLDADENLENYNRELIASNNSLSHRVYDLESRVAQQATIIDSLQNQINVSSNNFKGLFFTLADVPFKTVSNILGFEVFGVNLFNFFVGILTALGMIWLIKKFI